MYEKLKLFKIELDDIENINFENGMLQKIARQYADECDLKRLELVLNENIITAKDKFTGIHSYIGMRVSLEPLEKDISFIVRPTDKPTYDDLIKQNTELKEKQNYDLKWALKYDELYQENKELKRTLELVSNSLYMSELTQLKDNWNKLKEWLEECLNEIKEESDLYDRTNYQLAQITTLESTLAKLKEIEGGMNE